MIQPWRNLERRCGQGGFTLVEILVVIAIIALIVSLVGPSVLDLFNLDTGRYPTTSEGLVALIRSPGNIPSWNGPYLKSGSVPDDPWGKPYVYRSPGEHGAYDIMSYGSDGNEGGAGTAADITSWS